MILPMSFGWTTTKSVWTSGIFAATPRPASTNRSLTSATIGATSMATWSFFSLTAPSASPVRALSTAECTLRLPSTQTVSKALLVTTRSTVPPTSCSRPLVIGAFRLPTSWAALGGTPCSDTASCSCPTNASTSICASTTLVTRLVTALRTSGSEASGPTVAT
ncbi:hypothetical protein QFZ43_004155 [Streptomyces afghaniensis]|nr:hypothetical protein [Streptomyces afghaniensis]MDQ1017606.1 hypothetical protein [Streptomyces afghaniensis]